MQTLESLDTVLKPLVPGLIGVCLREAAKIES